MKFNVHGKLIHEITYPKNVIYRIIVIYVLGVTSLVILNTLKKGYFFDLNYYFITNITIVIVLMWFIRKSFSINTNEKGLVLLRIGIFLLINSALVSMAGGLGFMDRDTSALLASLLYAPAIFLIIKCLTMFIAYVNRNYESVMHMSLTDELTGLPNRRYLNIQLEKLTNKHCTICIADIDHFKKINDSFGHAVGDNILIRLGSNLTTFANEETFICRSGGEEFVIIFSGDVDVDTLLEKVKSSAFSGISHPANITLSIGVAVKDKYDSINIIIKHADDALYSAKENGRNCIMYYGNK